MRDAPSLSILPALLDRGARIIAHDPEGIDEAKNYLPNAMQYSNTIDNVIKGSDAIVLMTEWNQYRGLDLPYIKKLMNGNVFVDLRNVYEPEQMLNEGFEYFCIGRKKLKDMS